MFQDFSDGSKEEVGQGSEKKGKMNSCFISGISEYERPYYIVVCFWKKDVEF